jgi:hypothetical protein
LDPGGSDSPGMPYVSFVHEKQQAARQPQISRLAKTRIQLSITSC